VAAPETAVIPEEELIELSRKFALAGFQGIEESGDVLSDDMIFRGPGANTEYLHAVSTSTVARDGTNLRPKGRMVPVYFQPCVEGPTE
jgi:hypothetical protein